MDVRGFAGGRARMDWREALIARGFAWNVTVGSLSTGIVGGGNGTTLDQLQPEFGLSAPKGWTIIPLRFYVQCRLGLIANDSDVSQILIVVDRAAAFDGSGTTVAETPINMRNGLISGCPITCFSAGTGNITSPTLSFDLARAEAIGDVQDAAAVATLNVYQFDLLYEPKVSPFIVGPACIYGFFGGTVAATGYAQLEFAAVPSPLIASLS